MKKSLDMDMVSCQEMINTCYCYIKFIDLCATTQRLRGMRKRTYIYNGIVANV